MPDFSPGANLSSLNRVTAAAALGGLIIFLDTFERNDSFVLTGSRGGTLFQLRKLILFGGPCDPTLCKYTSCVFARFIDRFSKDAYSRLIEGQFAGNPAPRCVKTQSAISGSECGLMEDHGRQKNATRSRQCQLPRQSPISSCRLPLKSPGNRESFVRNRSRHATSLCPDGSPRP